MIIKIDLKKLVVSLIIPLAAGGLSALVTAGDMDLYANIRQPPLSPPSIVFPIVWTVLYTLMGISLYLVWTERRTVRSKKCAYTVFAIQLILNFIWSPIFFSAKQYLLAFAVLICLLVFTVIMTVLFYKISKPAGLLQIPYILWLVLAGYLNLGVYLLNK